MRILLSDASGLTARQSATRLSELGHHVEAVTPDPLCLCRFTRHVRRLHVVPAYGRDPFGWLAATLAVCRERQIDLILPTQEQVAVLARCRAEIEGAGVVTVVPAFAALRQVQDKISASATLQRVGVPQPITTVVHDVVELPAGGPFPFFVKLPIGTATRGVRRISGADDLERARTTLQSEARAGGLVVQQGVEGPLLMVQAVFDNGTLVAAHGNLRARLGVGGGASHKVGMDAPGPIRCLAALGAALEWHGPLSADVIVGPQGPVVIDVNPRLVEPANAWASGVDLVGALLAVAGGTRSCEPVRSDGARTHQLLLAVLGAAESGRGRRGVAAELWQAARRRGSYAGSAEELTPLTGDLRTAIPVVMAAVATLVRPSAWPWFASGSVAAYALTPDAWRAIVERESSVGTPVA